MQIIGKSVFLGHALNQRVFAELDALKVSRHVLFADSNVASLPHYASFLSDYAQHFDRPIMTFILQPGEETKSRKWKSTIEDFLFDQQCTRDTCLLAMGGGVVGDLIGFVAATYMRGIPVIQLPTSLLAMVDSSVGGKTAVDTHHGKNLVGAFWQPAAVFIDAQALSTLPRRHFNNGMAEVIKMAAVFDESFFSYLEQNVQLITARDVDAIKYIIAQSAGKKAQVVEQDAREAGLRSLLNFGHTIGHAIEADLAPELLHGEAISVGMVKEAEVARHLGLLSQVAVSRLARCLKLFGLPVSVECAAVKNAIYVRCQPLKCKRLMELMRVDKKNQGVKKRMVVLTAIGSTLELKASFVDDSVLQFVLSEAVRITPPSVWPESVLVNVPGSKSISNRALLLAALSSGTCRLTGLLHSDDTQVMLTALTQLGGLKYHWESSGEVLVIQGTGGILRAVDEPIYLGNAGTAARFVTTVCALAKVSTSSHTVITGNDRMKERPIGALVDALRNNNVQIECMEKEGCLPLKIACGGLPGGDIFLSASVSSQYVSSILLAAPYANSPVTLHLDGSISQPYINMTISMMRAFGAVVREKSVGVYHVEQKTYVSPGTYNVEPDASSATYPLALAGLTGMSVTVCGLSSKSLQGDTMFAVKVLKQMGADVSVSDDANGSITVKGSGKLFAVDHIDMEPMTDAFLTASVVAAVADCSAAKTTTISGIANQRVKECNRILAMVSELQKFGVGCSETQDGLLINARSRSELLIPPQGVYCYDDHRVAMSFSVLACALIRGGVVIREKKCVEKTWPTWWDVLVQSFGVKLDGVDAEHDQMSGTYSSDPAKTNKSIIVIGMRGAGKSTVCLHAAQILGRDFVDVDSILQQESGFEISDIVREKGWDEFRRLETEYLKQAVARFSQNAIVACGGGIVESEDNRALLKKWTESGAVIHLQREFDDVHKFLLSDPTRPSFADDIEQVWERRRPLYNLCSNYDLYSVSSAMATAKSLARLVNFLSGDAVYHIPRNNSANVFVDSSGQSSFFVSLTCGNVSLILDDLESIRSAADAIEIRIDLLDSLDYEFIARQIALLRMHSPLPIIYTVRTIGQGGKYSVSSEDNLFQLLDYGLRLGCEFVDMEMCWSQALIMNFCQKKGSSQIIASYHHLEKEAQVWAAPVIQKYLRLGNRFGDVIKIVVQADLFESNVDLLNMARSDPIFLNHKNKPVIAINMGRVGQMSRAANTTFTPVTHSKLNAVAAPGQLSVKQIYQFRQLLGVLPKKAFYLFGSPISLSMSPFLHNTIFDELGTAPSYSYDLHEVAGVDDALKDLLSSASFGGASVTIPLKESIFPALSILSEEAEVIGAVNTIVKNSNGDLVGHNTDWQGIMETARAKLSMLGDETESAQPASILIIGAGGTARAACYAASRIFKHGQSKVYLWNRTEENAAKVVYAFPHVHILLVKDASLIETVNGQVVSGFSIIISTIPGNVQVHLPSVLRNVFATSSTPGVLVELAYTPRVTELIGLARENGWIAAEGIEVLIEQGFCQSQLWTGHTVSRKHIKSLVMQQYESRQ